MEMNEEKNERCDMLVNGGIRKVVPRLVVPIIVSIMASSVYNMADTLFISRLSTNASGAAGIVFSVMAIIQTLSFTTDIGTNNHMARCPGVGRVGEDETVVSVAFLTDIILDTCLDFVYLLHADQIVVLLGAAETIEPYAAEYARYIFIATPFAMCFFIMNDLLHLQGLAAFVTIGITAGGILNIILDPLFIFDLNLRVSGIATVTGFSQFISFCTLLAQRNRREGRVPIRLRNFRPSLSLYGKIIYGGIPSPIRQGVANIATIALNITAHPLGDAAIAAMTIVSCLVYFISSTVIESDQDFQPICASSYGTKKYARVRQVYIFCVKFATCILIVTRAGISLISGHAISPFCRGDLTVTATGTLVLRLQLIAMWFNGFLTVSNMAPQSIGYDFRATLLSISRRELFLIPIPLLTAHFLGLLGIQVTQPTAGVCTLALMAFIIHGIFQSFPQESQEVRDIQGFQGAQS